MGRRFWRPKLLTSLIKGHSMSKRFRKLNMETMEPRQMMAGDVIASVTGGTVVFE